MSIQSEISRIRGNVQDTLSAIASTGVTVPEGANSDDLPTLTQTLANTKQDKLTGQQGQVVGFDASGNAVAQDSTGLTQEQADERYLKLSGGAMEDGAVLTISGNGVLQFGGTAETPYVSINAESAGLLRFMGAVLGGIGTPIANTDAANKEYVDNLVGDIGTLLDSINGEVV